MKSILLILLLLPLTQSRKDIVTPEDLNEWVTFLSRDEMRGRMNGSPEMEIAARWISSKFGEYNLRKIDGHDNFIQEYTYQGRAGSVNERNVVGWIEGSDTRLKDEFIVISAHFDHIGVMKGESADSIFNGADDNAAGTATVIAIAKYFHESGKKPGRSIIFAAFSGEENGMRGSRHFVANLPIAASKIYANLNFEMTGHSEELGKGKYYMTGCPFSNLDDIMGSYSKSSGLELIDNIPVTNMLFNASDNIAFSRMSVTDGITTGIPSGTFATTTMAGHVHNVNDEARLFDFSNMSVLVNHFAESALKLSNEKKEVVWTDTNYKRP